MKQHFSAIQTKVVISLLTVALGISSLFLWYANLLDTHSPITNLETDKKLTSEPTSNVQSRSNAILALAEQKAAAADIALKNNIDGPKEINPIEKKAKEIWKAADKNTKSSIIPLAELIKEYQAIELDQNPDSYPTIGDQVRLPLLNGESVTAEVEDVTLNPNGDYTWTGHIVGAGNDHMVVFTYGENSTFASISTADGSYSLETVGGSGWLYKNLSMAQMAATNKSDTIELHIHD